MKKNLLSLVLLCCALAGCGDLYEYGQLGGADQNASYYPNDANDPNDPGNPNDPGEPNEPSGADKNFEALMASLSGVWYSHWAGIGRLDGYRIGRWGDFKELVIDSGKVALVPGIYDHVEGGDGDPDNALKARTYTGYDPDDDDYFVLYDSSVYGQKEDDGPSAEGWSYNFGFCGIVRAVNVFNGDRNRGAIIIEYLKDCAPGWLDRWPESKTGGRPFFGIYYRVLDRDTVQMANAVDLAALYAGKRYYTETETLDEAIEKNNVENEAEFISWGIVIPQDRE